MKERVAIYVDGANVYFAQKEALGWWIDWPSFLDTIGEGNTLVSANWYQAYRITPEADQDRFLHHLTLVGFAVRKKILKSVYDRSSGVTSLKGNLDISLTIDAITESDHYDTAILVTGDSDFVPLVEALRARGKKVMVAATQENVAVELRQSVGLNYLDLRDLRAEIESDKRPPEMRDRHNGDSKASSYVDATSDDTDEFDEEGYHDFVDGDEGEQYDGGDPPPPSAPTDDDIDLPQEGEIVRCCVQAVKRYGIFLDLHEGAKTLLHVKDMNRGFVPDAGEFYHVGDELTVQVVSIDRQCRPPQVRVQIITSEMEY